MTDVVVNNYTSYKVPQMAPVAALIPMTVMFYTIRQYGLMRLKKSDKAENGKILSEVNMDKFINIMFFVYIIGGMLNFVAQYFLNRSPPKMISILLFSAFFFIIGVTLVIVKSLPIKASHKEFIFILIMLISILMIAVNFIDSASITVWAAPFIIVMLSVLFNNRLLIFMTSILILATQIYIWIKMPFAKVQVDGSDYLSRIIIFCITLWLAYFINRVYVQRLEENEAQVRFQRMVSQVSSDFVLVAESNLDEKIGKVLEIGGQYFEVDRTFFYDFH